MNTVKTFSCGRGTHRIFVMRGVNVIETGYMQYRRTSPSTNSVTMDTHKVTGLWAKVKAYFDYKSHKSSPYFGDTSDITAKDTKGLL